MSKKSTLVYVDKVSSKPAKALGAISITAGMRKSIRLSVAHSEGWVNEVVVKQASGTAVGFDVELLDSCVPYHNGDNTLASYEAAYNAAAAIDVEMFQVIDKITTTSGNTAKLRTSELGYPYINADQVSQTANENFLYLCIIPNNATGTTTWKATITTSKSIS